MQNDFCECVRARVRNTLIITSKKLFFQHIVTRGLKCVVCPYNFPWTYNNTPALRWDDIYMYCRFAEKHMYVPPTIIRARCSNCWHCATKRLRCKHSNINAAKLFRSRGHAIPLSLPSSFFFPPILCNKYRGGFARRLTLLACIHIHCIMPFLLNIDSDASRNTCYRGSYNGGFTRTTYTMFDSARRSRAQFPRAKLRRESPSVVPCTSTCSVCRGE